MARIAGVNLPPNKQIEASLPYIFGIGPSLARKILTSVKVNPRTRTKDLSEADVNRLREEIESKYRVEGELRREVLGNIKRLRDITSYRGTRHARKLPVRGQRTRTNTRTVRGNVRRTMGSGRKASAEKT